MVAGLAESTMSRDEGWRFLRPRPQPGAGRHDRAAAVVQLSTSDTAGDWRTVLRACGADESFLRTHGGTLEPARVIEFLMLDRLFPRSVFAALVDAERCLRDLAPVTERAGVRDAARRPIGQVRTRLEYADLTHLVEELPAHLRALQQACAACSAAVTTRYFKHAAPVAWAHEES